MILYKYRNDSEYTEAIIKNNTVWFSKPSELNDPLECSIQAVSKKMTSRAIDREIREYIKPYNQKNRKTYELKSEKISNEIIRLINLHGGFYKGVYNEKQADQRLYKDIFYSPHIKYLLADKIIENAGLFCLSQNADNALMWSHYGDNGKGIAVGFSVSQKEDYNDFADYCMLLKVNYSNENISMEKITQTTIGAVGDQNTVPLNFQVPEFNDPFMKKVFSTKNTVWSYEQEWRLVCQFWGEREFKTTINEIVFGPRCTYEVKLKYYALAQKFILNPINFFEIVIKDRIYYKEKCSFV